MGTRIDPAAVLRHRLIDELDRDYAWLARATGIRYKRVLAEVKHGTTPIDLVNAITYAKALGLTLPALAKAE